MNGEFNAAVHALVCMSHKGSLLSSETLAANICTNPARVRKIMAKLKSTGIVASKEGPEGGYSSALPAGETTLALVARAVDARFISPGWHSGDVDMKCLIASGMAGLLEEVYSRMDALCQGYLDSITIADLEARIFGQTAE
ncbi:MAG: Rrf2 family transcriptional regulator [Candidatus Pelethousia sp.]|nr:Rrf2 family transcriptional regulator [Candidatus Pelethousia sp.]